MQVDPADLRFTQDSIGLYFQYPYHHFSIREAVRKISRNEMRPDEFPLIRVILYGGCLWSVDNRRLWVFRLARCSSVAVQLVTEMHPRLQEVVVNLYMYSKMQGENFFPRVRDRGQNDSEFDCLFPEPVSFQQRVYEALVRPPMNMAQDNAKQADQYALHIQIERSGRTTSPSIHPVQGHEKDEDHSETSQPTSSKIVRVARLSMNAVSKFFCFAARKTCSTIASKLVSVVRMTRNAALKLFGI